MIVKVKNKEVKVPDEEIKNLMDKLELTEQEAIQTWLEDEGYEVNEEVERLTAKAKANGTARINARANVENKKTTRERKANPVKEEIIQILANALKNSQNLPINAIKIENIGKIITFKVENREFKLDLIEKRQRQHNSRLTYKLT